MLLIHCPYCDEDRPELEFAYAGEAHIARPEDPSALTDQEWRDFLFVRTNPKGVHFERWRHINGCARFFNAARDTITDRFLLTYKAGEPKPDLEKLKADGGPAAWANRPPDQLNEKPKAKRSTKGEA
jgi:sarcosine oxidase subunit delta